MASGLQQHRNVEATRVNTAVAPSSLLLTFVTSSPQAHFRPVFIGRSPGNQILANEVSLCQIQIGIWLRPHSVNVNCMATPEGALFISCSVGAQKYWCPRVGQDHSGRLRLDGVVYPVFLNREMDPAMLDRVWASRIRKLQKPQVHARQPGSGDPPPLDTPRPDSWWTFRVESRT